jgi:hypothetical protein
MNDGEIKFKVTVDSASAEQSIKSLNQKASDLSSSFKNTGKNMTMGLTLPIVAFGTAAVNSAMELEATEAKYNTVFKGMTKDVDAFIKDFQKLTPATTASARSMASGIQDLLVPMGFAREEATKMTGDTMHLIGALTNFNSATHSAEDVAGAFQSALTGETQSLKALGIQVGVAEIEERALIMTGKKSTKQLTKQDKAAALLKLAYEQSADALAAYNEANLDTKTKLEIATKAFQDQMGVLGLKLIPILTKGIGLLNKLTKWFSNLTEGQKKTILVVLGIVAALGPLLMIIGNVITVVQGLNTAFTFLAANPLLLQIGLLIIALGILYDSYKKVSGAVKELNDLSAKNTDQSQENIKNTKEATKSATSPEQKERLIGLYNTQLARAVGSIKSKEEEIAKAKKGAFYFLVKDSLNSSLKNYQNEASTLRTEITKLGGTPKLATGTNNVKGDGLAYLHQGEAVVPKKYNPAMGGTQTLFITMGDIVMDGRTVGRSLTPYITKTVKVGGGNV